MEEIKITVLHPTDGRQLTITLDDDMTGQEFIDALLENDFIVATTEGYILAIKGSGQIRLNETLAYNHVINGTMLRIVPATDAGGIIGVTKKALRKVTLKDIQNSPHTITMILHQYDELQNKYDIQLKELEYEKLKGKDRFTATILLLISQIIISIGVNLLTDSQFKIAIPVLIAGSVQTLLAIYFIFKKP